MSQVVEDIRLACLKQILENQMQILDQTKINGLHHTSDRLCKETRKLLKEQNNG